MHLLILSFIIPIIMASLFIIWRIKATERPITKRKIILPPIMMSTGAFMYIFPAFRIGWQQILEALTIGFFFSIILILNTKFEIREQKIYVKYSKAFGVILIVLLIIRTMFKFYLTLTIDVGETGGMFWMLAFGMIVPWRVAMYIQYNKMVKKISPHFVMNSTNLKNHSRFHESENIRS